MRCDRDSVMTLRGIRWLEISCGLNRCVEVVEERFEHTVVQWADPLAPDRFVLAERVTGDRVAEECAADGRFELEPVLRLQFGWADDAKGAHCARAIDLLPEHRSRFEELRSTATRGGSDVCRPDPIKVGDEPGYLLRRCSEDARVLVCDLHLRRRVTVPMSGT